MAGLSTPESTCPICEESTRRIHVEPSAAISTHLEHITRGSIDAINSRDFSIYSNAWKHFIPGFKVESAQPVFPWLNCVGSNVGLERHLKALRKLTAMSAGFHIRLLDLDTQIDERPDRAVVFANTEITGDSQNMVMQGVIILGFRMIGKEWKCVKFTGARGIL